MKKGKPLSETNKKGISDSLKGKPKTKEHIDNFIKSRTGKCLGSENGNAKEFRCISPSGEEFLLKGNIREFCKLHEWDYSQMRSYCNKGKIEKCRKEKYLGWEFIV